MRDLIRPDASFTPRELFSRMQGAWFEPRTGYMWQENTGVTPTTSGGQTIGKLVDLSADRVASQATAANRPLFGARRNLLTYSEDFSNVVWSKNNINLLAGQIDPFGGTTATLVTENTATGQHIIYQQYIGAANTYSGKLCVKQNGKRYISLRIDNGASPYACIDLQTGTVVVGSGVSVTSLSNGWFLLVTTKTTASGSPYFSLEFLQSASITSYSYTGDGVSGVYVCRPQVELGSTATDYQRVTTATDYDAGRFPAIRHADSSDVLAAAMPAINVRRNLLTYSEQFDNAAWPKASCSVAGPVVNNGFYGQKISVSNNGEVAVNQLGLPTQGVAYRFTVVAKALGTTQYLFITCAYAWTVTGLVRAWFDIKNGVVSWAALEDAPSIDISATTCSITPVSGGGYECVFSPPVRAGNSPQFGFGVSSANKGLGGMSGKEFILARAQVTLASEPNNSYQKITDWTSEAYSSSGSVYFATPTGMSALHNQSIGTSYNLPALQTDIYGVVITPARLVPPLEQRLALYMHRLAGLADADFFWQELATDGMTGQLLTDDDTILLRG